MDDKYKELNINIVKTYQLLESAGLKMKTEGLIIAAQE